MSVGMVRILLRLPTGKDKIVFIDTYYNMWPEKVYKK